MKTGAELRSLAEQRAWDKEIAIWIGSCEALLAVLPSGTSGPDVQQLDLLDLLAGIEVIGDEVANRFKLALRGRLQDLRPAHGTRRVLIVASSPLLVHYNLGLREFFDWFCSDRSFVILQIEGFADRLSLPTEFEFHPRKVVEYLAQPGLAKNTYA